MARELTHQIVIRVDDALLEALKTNAQVNGRTVAQSVRWLLKKQLGANAVRTRVGEER